MDEPVRSTQRPLQGTSPGTAPTAPSPQHLSHRRSARSADEWLLVYWAANVDRTGDEARDLQAAAEALDAASTKIDGALEAMEAVPAAAERLQRAQTDPRITPEQLDRLMQRSMDAEEALRKALTLVLEAGLRRRRGLLLGTEWSVFGDFDARVFRSLQAAGAKMPNRLSVCQTCSLVFEPRKREQAWLCDACHKRPHADPPLALIPNAGGGWTSTGLPGITERVHHYVCMGCGELFPATRSDARYCGATCRKTGNRPTGQGPACDLDDPMLQREQREAATQGAASIVADVLFHSELRRSAGDARRLDRGRNPIEVGP